MRLVMFACRLSMPRRKAAERTHLRSRGKIALPFRVHGETPREQVSRFMRNRRRRYIRPASVMRRGREAKGGELTLATHSNSGGDATTCNVLSNVAHN